MERAMTDDGVECQPAVFDPSRYLTRVNGKSYLEVRFRVVWARRAQPDISIVTEPVELDERRAVFRATVSWATPDGIVQCTDYGTESTDDFADYIEKASTKAIGRALALAGFGTQFCDDHVYGDAPAEHPPANVRALGGGENRALATPRQFQYLRSIARDLLLTEEDLDSRSRDEFGTPLADLSRRQVSALIEMISADRPPRV